MPTPDDATPITGGSDHSSQLSMAMSDFHVALQRRWLAHVTLIVYEQKPWVTSRFGDNSADEELIDDIPLLYEDSAIQTHVDGSCAFVRWADQGNYTFAPSVECQYKSRDSDSGEEEILPCPMGELYQAALQYAEDDFTYLKELTPRFETQNQNFLETGILGLREMAISLRDSIQDYFSGLRDGDSNEAVTNPSKFDQHMSNIAAGTTEISGWTGNAADEFRHYFLLPFPTVIANQGEIAMQLHNLAVFRHGITHMARENMVTMFKHGASKLKSTSEVKIDQGRAWDFIQDTFAPIDLVKDKSAKLASDHVPYIGKGIGTFLKATSIDTTLTRIEHDANPRDVAEDMNDAIAQTRLYITEAESEFEELTSQLLEMIYETDAHLLELYQTSLENQLCASILQGKGSG